MESRRESLEPTANSEEVMSSEPGSSSTTTVGLNSASVPPQETQGPQPDFVDALFAIVIGLALEKTFVEWHLEPRNPRPSALIIATVITGLVNILLSWQGYHASIQTKPIKGALRFWITAILVVIYMFITLVYS